MTTCFASPWGIDRGLRRPQPSLLVGLAFGLALLCSAGPEPCLAGPPSPITAELFSFPGAVTHPGSAVSAGVALSDRWLGDEPFNNPAVALGSALVVSPVLQRMSRQDLRAPNRHFDEQGAFFDGAGAWVGFPEDRWEVLLYVFQPVLRREENAFERGEFGGPVQPAVIQSNATSRELRAGLGASTGIGIMRFGVGAEWNRRDDHYETNEQSGSPDQGRRRVEFSGDGFCLQSGVRLDTHGDPNGSGAFSLGAEARYLSELSLNGEQSFDLLSGSSHQSVSARREAGWEGGLSARYAVTSTFRVLAGAGGHTAQKWQGFDVVSGKASLWSAGFEYHDPEVKWTVRFGVGAEQQEDVPESRAGVLGLGFGWRFSDSVLDFGILRRSIDRGPSPTSYDDRLVASLGLTF